MRNILRFFIILITISGVINALDFKQTKIIKLKKDEQKKILVKYEDFEKLFVLRWTLYKNGGLIIHRSYDKIVSQNILYERYKNNSFRLELRSRGKSKNFSAPYFLVKFEKFDFVNNEATFKLFLFDNTNSVKLEDI